MSKNSKIVLGVVALAIIALGAYYWHQNETAGNTAPNSEEVTTLPSGTNTSDSSIEQDLNSIDAQIQAARNDSADASASVDAAAAQ